MLARDDKILEKIIAMGQREVFFPLTDQVHAFISYAVEEIIGSIEPLFGGGEEGAYKYEQAQTEIRFLRDTLKNLAIPAHPKVHELYELQHLATLWVYIRNLNAHIQMLRHDKLKTAMEYYAKLYKNVIPGRDSN
ncbi:MAG: hypothetical protein LBF40_05685, partial [Deltaproteobacteria bacterium]|jgi:hypothetical protein|nr:hypothetical protein [Deltaproteobacteria bacterium]